MEKQWLREEVEKRGRGAQAALAKHLGMSASVLNKLINTPRKITANEADGIRDWLAKNPPGSELPRPSPPEPQQPGLFQEEAARHRQPTGGARVDPYIAVHASAQGGNDDVGAIVLSSEPVRWIARPQILEGVVGAYAVLVSGSSMEPAYEAGNLALVDPSVQASPGSYCIFQARREDGSPLALIKRLVRDTAAGWVVRQFNPDKTFTLKRPPWDRPHVIVGKYERG